MTATTARIWLWLAVLLCLPPAGSMPVLAADHAPPPLSNRADSTPGNDQDEASYFLRGLPDLRQRLSLSPLQHAPWYAAEATSKAVLNTLWQRDLPLGQWRQQLDNPEAGFAELADTMLVYSQQQAEQWQQFLTAWKEFDASLDSAQKETLRRFWRDWTVHCQVLQTYRKQARDESRRSEDRRPSGGPPPGGPGIRGSF